MTTDELEWQQTLTSNPCPAWCSSPANHGYDEVVAKSNRLSRTHILDVGSLATADGGHFSSTSGSTKRSIVMRNPT